MTKGWLEGVGEDVETRPRPVITIELVRSIEGRAGLEGTLMAVAPASTYWEPTVTVVIMPLLPSEVVKTVPMPRIVMTGGVVSGWAAAAAAATAAGDNGIAAAAEADDPLVAAAVVPVALEEELMSDERRAAAAPQFWLTLHFSVSLHVLSPFDAQRSYTDRLLEATTRLPDASEAKYVTRIGSRVAFDVQLPDGQPTTVTLRLRPKWAENGKNVSDIDDREMRWVKVKRDSMAQALPT
jgi:hypothetical protein